MARILVIDDEELVRLTVGRILRVSGHDVLTASNGEEGINVFQQQPVDLVITDVRMPGLTGPDVIKALRSLRPETRVIIMGGSGSLPAFGVQAYARQVGAGRALSKPFAVGELNAAVVELLGVAAN